MAMVSGRDRSGSASVNEMLTWLALARWLAEEVELKDVVNPTFLFEQRQYLPEAEL
jgi:hypothetical protein